MYYILGINHYIQYVNKQIPIQLFSEFVSYVSNMIDAKDISMIAEEFNEDCLELNHVKHSVLQLISEEASIAHRFVDPPQKVRTALGMTITWLDDENDKDLSTRKRERYWLNQIEAHKSENILVCIGASHVKPFTNLLEENMLEYCIMDTYWRENAFIQGESTEA